MTIEAATNSQDAIKRIGNGDADIALADLSTLIRYRDTEKALPIKAVLVVYNKAPYAMVARKSRGIKTIADIEGSEQLQPSHLAEAISYRNLDRSDWAERGV